MGKKKWLRVLAIVLVIACLAGTAAAAGSNLSGLNINGDSIVNIWDAQSVLFDTDRDQLEKDQFLTGIKNTVLGLDSDEIEYNSTGGYYEINSVLDLYQMAYLGAESEGKTFVLTEDLNLEGADWKPIRNFAGTFKGGESANDRHMIYNFTITKPAVDATNDAVLNMGFFGNITTTATVQNLHLADFTIIASGTKALFVGGVVGSNRGKVIECTVDGRIIDNREETDGVDGHSPNGEIYRGILVGRTTKSSDGYVQTGTMTVEAGKDLVLGNSSQGANVERTVASAMALDLVDDKYGNTYTTAAQIEARRKEAAETPLVGDAPSGTLTGENFLWQDTSYSTEWETETAQAERQAAVNYMYKMGTIQWTPSETIQFLKNDSESNIHSNWYVAGVTYTGIPYNGGAGSLERMLSRMDLDGDGEEDELSYNEDGSVVFDPNRIYTTIKGLETGYTNSPVALGDVTKTGFYGFVQYMGNDCSSAIGSAWATISHSRIPKSGYTGFELRTTDRMVPGGIYYYYKTDDNGDYVLDGNAEKVILPSFNTIGQVDSATQDSGKGMQPVGRYLQIIGGKETYIESGYTNEVGTKDTRTLMTNLLTESDDQKQYGKLKRSATTEVELPTAAEYALMAEYYAMTRMGDALVGSDITNEATESEVLVDANGKYLEEHDGHARMVAYDPVVIRDASNSGTIDLQKSYFITHEQGDGLFNNQTTATVNGETKTIKTSSWRTNWLYSFEDLLTRWMTTENNDTTSFSYGSTVTGCAKNYVPVTIEAYTSENTSTWVQMGAANATVQYPDQNSIYSHWRVISSELTVYEDTNENGTYDAGVDQQVHRETGWEGVGSSYNTYRALGSLSVNLKELHGNYVANAKEQSGYEFVDGNTYHFSIQLRLSNGRVVSLTDVRQNPDKNVMLPSDTVTFTYQAATTTTTE